MRGLMLVVGLVVACGAGGGSGPRAPTLRERQTQLLAALTAAQQIDHAATVAAVSAHYEQLFPPQVRREALRHGSVIQASVIFDSAELAVLHTLEPAHVAAMIEAHAVLARAGVASASQTARLREAMLKARMFDSPLATALGLPRLIDESAGVVPSELIVGPGATEVRRRAVPMSGIQIIVVAHPRCHFSAAAIRAIDADPELRAVFAQHARWLLPQEASPSLELVASWNAAHPALSYTLAYRKTELAVLDSWNTPTFYVLRDGQVVARVEGWPKLGRHYELREALATVGLAR